MQAQILKREGVNKQIKGGAQAKGHETRKKLKNHLARASLAIKLRKGGVGGAAGGGLAGPVGLAALATLDSSNADASDAGADGAADPWGGGQEA